MTRKRTVSALVAVPALVLLLASTRTWLSGRSSEPLLGGGAVTATGAQLAPGVLALALVALVALTTTLTGGVLVRRLSAVVLLAAAAGAAALTAPSFREPEAALGRVAAASLGRTGLVSTTAEKSAWMWVALVSAVLLVGSAVLTVAASGRWGGLSRRFDAPSIVDEPSRAVSTDSSRSAWDDLSEGRDPTTSPPGSPGTETPGGIPDRMTPLASRDPRAGQPDP